MSGAKSGAQAIAWILIILGGAAIWFGGKIRNEYGGLEDLTWAGSIGTLGAAAFFLGVAVMCATLLATYIVDELSESISRRIAAAAAPPLPPEMRLSNQPGWQPPPAGPPPAQR